MWSIEVLSAAVLGQVPWKRAAERGETPVLAWNLRASAHTLKELSILGLMIKAGGKFLLKLNIGGRPIAHNYREGKMQITLKRELKST